MVKSFGKTFESAKAILERRFAKKSGAHAKYEFQEYGIWLGETLHDKRHKSLYIKLAKEKPRKFLDEARIFAIDYPSRSTNRGRLFMWKLAELEKEFKKKSSSAKIGDL